MSAVMSPIWVGAQLFNNQGVILSGGQIFTYAAGTTTPAATYTDNTLGTPNGNPIVLDSSGRYSQQIWWSSGSNFKFILKDASNNTIQTEDNIVGVNDVGTQSVTEWTTSNLTPTYVSATSFTVVGNQTSIFTANARLKTTNTGGTIYSTVTSSSFSAPNTTVNVTNDSSTLDSGLSVVSYSFLGSVHPSTPAFLDVQPVVQNASDGTKLIKFSASGITTGNTRTFTAPDKSGTLAMQADVFGVVSVARKAQMSVTSASATGTFTADEIQVETALGSNLPLVLPSYSQACNLGTTGAGGMDTGTAPISGFVSLYAIAKTDGTKGILACAVATSTASIYAGANMPAGYTYSALIGIWPTNGSSQFVPGYIIDRKFMYQSWVSVVSAHAQITSLTSQSISGAVPVAARTASCLVACTTSTINFYGGAAGDGTGTGGKQSDFSSASQASPSMGGLSGFYGSVFCPDIPLITAQTVYWFIFTNANSTGNLAVSDYTF